MHILFKTCYTHLSLVWFMKLIGCNSQYHFVGHESFDYEGFFEKKIKEKLDTNTYRRFRIVDRDANQFPECSYQGNTNSDSIQVIPQKATVWCSNDYLGMSRHPEVLEATM